MSNDAITFDIQGKKLNLVVDVYIFYRLKDWKYDRKFPTNRSTEDVRRLKLIYQWKFLTGTTSP